MFCFWSCAEGLSGLQQKWEVILESCILTQACVTLLSSTVGAFIRTGYSWLSPAGSTAKIIAEGNVVHFSLSSLIPIQYLFRKMQ